jgi:uncharacterized protein YfiM (DUF2279 family)
MIGTDTSNAREGIGATMRALNVIRPARLAACALGALLALAVATEAAAPPVRQATLSWGAVTQDVEGNAITGVTYNVYRGARGATKARIATGLAALTYVDSGRPAGVEDCYQVTAAKGDLESDPSSEGCKSYPAVAPGAPPGLTVQ